MGHDELVSNLAPPADVVDHARAWIARRILAGDGTVDDGRLLVNMLGINREWETPPLGHEPGDCPPEVCCPDHGVHRRINRRCHHQLDGST